MAVLVTLEVAVIGIECLCSGHRDTELGMGFFATIAREFNVLVFL